MNLPRCLLAILLLMVTNSRSEPPAFLPPDQSSTEGTHTISIKRTFANDELGKLILAAESLAPPRAEVVSVLEDRGNEAMQRLQPKDLWWYSSFDSTLIPYALTSGCLTHLTERSNAFVKSVAEGKPIIGSKHSKLNYTATAARHEQIELEGQKFRNVTVVTMNLEWSQQSMWFSKKRVVVFDGNGKTVRVFHDGTTDVGVI
ncbi:hypothetical protein OKA05_00490 [Luteolibacter arcticus]|uniref:Uncharacterized protein n=1 Tax=Luteolibacter arcticus TaxID=1581411 RepID=A0ABT3GBL0_9BACT|nr:hypothetical protein [Luteolibacter arcticus]MCW1921010.1 hypothetical protein [Luteolibacter arcticus]